MNINNTDFLKNIFKDISFEVKISDNYNANGNYTLGDIHLPELTNIFKHLYSCIRFSSSIEEVSKINSYRFEVEFNHPEFYLESIYDKLNQLYVDIYNIIYEKLMNSILKKTYEFDDFYNLIQVENLNKDLILYYNHNKSFSNYNINTSFLLCDFDYIEKRLLQGTFFKNNQISHMDWQDKVFSYVLFLYKFKFLIHNKIFINHNNLIKLLNYFNIDKKNYEDFYLNVDQTLKQNINKPEKSSILINLIFNFNIKLLFNKDNNQNNYQFFPSKDYIFFFDHLLYLPFTSFNLNQNFTQKLFIGNIGTGKSKLVNDLTHKDSVYRIMFSNNLNYDFFIGRIISVNQFIPGIFIEFYIQSLINLINHINIGEKLQHHSLIIEEINRGNSLDILDFVSNLIDRDYSGFSDYPINLNETIYNYIITRLKTIFGERYAEKLQNLYFLINEGKKFISDINGKIIIDKISLLPNMSIYGTMNVNDRNIQQLDFMLIRRFTIHFLTNNTNDFNYLFFSNEEHTHTKKLSNLLQKINKKIKMLFPIDYEFKSISIHFFNNQDKIEYNNDLIITFNAIKYKLFYHLYYNILYSYNPEETQHNIMNFFKELLLFEDLININDIEHFEAMLR